MVVEVGEILDQDVLENLRVVDEQNRTSEVVHSAYKRDASD